MTPVSLGKITTSAGVVTPVTADKTIKACKIRFRAVNANVGLINIGLAGFTPGGAGMIGEVLKPNSGYSDEVDIESDCNDLYPSDYAVAAVTSADGVYVTYWVK